MIIGKKMEIFLAVARAGSFSAATKELSISQSAVSHHIELLERELGVALFERRGRSIKLTGEGNILYEKGAKLSLEAERLEEEVAETSSHFSHRILLAGDALTCSFTLPWNLAAFRREHPKVVFSYEHLNIDVVLDRLLREEIDIALVGEHIRHQRLLSQPCYLDEIILTGQPGSVPDSIKINELPSIPLGWINKDKGLNMCVQNGLSKAGMPVKNLNLFIEAHELSILKSFVRTGVVCAFLPKITVEDELAFGLLKHIRVEGLRMERTTYLMHRKTAHTKDVVARFIAFIAARLFEENRRLVESTLAPV